MGTMGTSTALSGSFTPSCFYYLQATTAACCTAPPHLSAVGSSFRFRGLQSQDLPLGLRRWSWSARPRYSGRQRNPDTGGSAVNLQVGLHVLSSIPDRN
ncbi:hypothetical protein NDU88_004632 [Pleurodeles waltl]|uniref:Uncharacterized protein n=1 Tax=Pleurodeles waltl TaxID=8319 RepID=A0AAV7VIT3_PLEWA|nr:hypothetical protein NDU88_004632 [Pleurodeles waltl]